VSERGGCARRTNDVQPFSPFPGICAPECLRPAGAVSFSSIENRNPGIPEYPLKRFPARPPSFPVCSRLISFIVDFFLSRCHASAADYPPLFSRTADPFEASPPPPSFFSIISDLNLYVYISFLLARIPQHHYTESERFPPVLSFLNFGNTHAY